MAQVGAVGAPGITSHFYTFLYPTLQGIDSGYPNVFESRIVSHGIYTSTYPLQFTF